MFSAGSTRLFCTPWPGSVDGLGLTAHSVHILQLLKYTSPFHPRTYFHIDWRTWRLLRVPTKTSRPSFQLLSLK